MVTSSNLVWGAQKPSYYLYEGFFIKGFIKHKFVQYTWWYTKIFHHQGYVMKKCLKCENTIPYKLDIDGKLKVLSGRKYCFDCSPYGQHNTRQLHSIDKKPLVNTCNVCNKQYPGGHQQHKNICNACRVTQTRQNKKLKAVQYMGGKCIICNYNKCISALHFHHIEPHQKEFGFSSNITKSFDVLKKELDKCIIVCSNCHCEIHSGLINIDDYIDIQSEIRSSYVEEAKPEKFFKPVVKISKKPSKEVLEKLVWEMPCVKIGEMFGVSDNAVNKWCKIYEISKPGRGYWEKLKHDKI